MDRAGLIDLGELVLRCRDVQARVYIREAVACYRAGEPLTLLAAASSLRPSCLTDMKQDPCQIQRILIF